MKRRRTPPTMKKRLRLHHESEDMAEKFTAGKFGLRALFALLLVVLTFNPTGYSYVHMIVNGFPKITPVEAVCGILLLIGWFVYLSATLRSRRGSWARYTQPIPPCPIRASMV